MSKGTRKIVLVIGIKRFSFTDENNNDRLVQGVSITSTDGNLNSDPDTRGLSILRHTLNGRGYYENFAKLPEPPFFAGIQIEERNRKVILTQIYDVVDLQKNFRPMSPQQPQQAEAKEDDS